MAYRRNDDALKEALDAHNTVGTNVVVPVFNEATILEQWGTGPVKRTTASSVELGSPLVYYKVKAKKPVSFATWVDKRLGSRAMEQLTLAQWTERRGRVRFQEGEASLFMPDYLSNKLEAGGTLSPADVEHDDLVHRGCIDPDGNVNCYTFWSNEVLIDRRQLERGMLVEYEEGKGEHSQILKGAIAGFSKDKKVAYLELFTPMPYLDLPDAISNESIQKGFYAPVTYAFGYGTYDAFMLAAEESGQLVMPPGKWDDPDPKEARLYTLKEFFPISVIQEICTAAGDDATSPWCLWQALIMYVFPAALEGVHHADEEGEKPLFYSPGIWRPLQNQTVSYDDIISYEDEGEEG